MISTLKSIAGLEPQAEGVLPNFGDLNSLRLDFYNLLIAS